MAKQVEAYQVVHTAKEIEDLLTKVKNTEEELVDSDNPVSSKAVLVKFEELKKAVSDGKKLVADAITEKGIFSATINTFQELANNILAISTNDTGIGLNFIVPQITRSGHAGNKTINDYGAIIFEPISKNFIIPEITKEGYVANNNLNLYGKII